MPLWNLPLTKNGSNKPSMSCPRMRPSKMRYKKCMVLARVVNHYKMLLKAGLYAGRDGEKISALMHIHWTEEADGDIDSIESYLEGEKLDNETIKGIINPIILAPYRLKKHPRL